MLDVCAAVCRERAVRLIAGAGSNTTAAFAAELQDLVKRPAVDAALTVIPYYTGPGVRRVLAHFTALAATSPVPLVIYHIPHRTGQQVSAQVMLELAALADVAGVKYAPGGIDADTVTLLGSAPSGFAVQAGEDAVASALLAIGAAGAIMASAHVCTSQYAALVRAWIDGDARTARVLGHRLAALSLALFAEPNPAVIKAVLHAQGLIATPDVRLPLLPAIPDSTAAALHLTDW